MKYITEPEKQLPVAIEVDVAVVGGGVSGIAAAIAAARAGANTLLIERLGWLAGYFDSGWGAATHGIVFQDESGKQIMRGICWEIVQRMEKMGGAVPPVQREFLKNTWPIEAPFAMWKSTMDQELGKEMAFEMTEEAGVKLLLHTWTSGAIVEDGVIRGVTVENKGGRQAILAKVVVDCSGDADVAARAGVPFDMVGTDQVYEVSRSFNLANVDTERIRQDILAHLDDYAFVMQPKSVPAGYDTPLMTRSVKANTLEITDNGRIIKGGPGSHGGESIGYRRGIGGVGASADGIDGTNPWDLTRAEVEIRRKSVQAYFRMRKERPGYENCWLMPGSLDLGVRESRRIKGEYTITEQDVMEGRKFDDAIVQTQTPLDMHLQGSSWEEDMPTGVYDIPYRAMVPLKVDNLLVAGRSISMDHRALAGLRKIPVCMADGQAAGVAAALCAKEGVTPRKLDVKQLQRELLKQDVVLRDDLVATL